jgi:hypothetical protein
MGIYEILAHRKWEKKILARAKSVKINCSFFEDGKDEEEVKQSCWKVTT